MPALISFRGSGGGFFLPLRMYISQLYTKRNEACTHSFVPCLPAAGKQGKRRKGRGAKKKSGKIEGAGL